MNAPQWNRATGSGTFTLNDKDADSRFEILQNPHWIRVITKSDDLANLIKLETIARNPGRLRGRLDDGRPVLANRMIQTRLRHTDGGQEFEFCASEGVSFGEEPSTPPTGSRYYLTGYFDGAFSVSHDGWTIEVIEPDGADLGEAKELSDAWDCPIEGMTLRLHAPGASRSEHEQKARVVMMLLSFAAGTGVSCHRRRFIWDNHDLGVWQLMMGDESGPGPIVPAFQVGHFVEQALPIWYALSEDQRRCVRLAVTYLNLTARGYLDTKIFHLMQAWEFLARAWDVKSDPPESIMALKSLLDNARKQWRESYPKEDHSFWGSRISQLFDWTKLKATIEGLARLFGIDLKIHGMDLDALKEARDGVAHSGRLPPELLQGDRRANELWLIGQYCLQLLLLRILGYKGLVNGATNGWLTALPIDQAIRTKRTVLIT